MKDRILLREVLAQSAAPEFQSALFERTLSAARRRKQVRQAGSMALAAAVVLIGLVLLRPDKTQKSVAIVHSKPLRSEMVLATRPSVPQVSSSNRAFAVVISQSGGFKILGDDELLGCLAGHPAALVRKEGGGAELVFVNPADRHGFPVAQPAP